MDILDIMNGVKAKIETKLPGEPVYTNRVEEGFTRPSSMLECGKVTVDAMNGSFVEYTLQVKVTSFVKVDEYYDSQFDELLRRQSTLMGIFWLGVDLDGGYLQTISLEGDYGLDYTEVNATLQWNEYINSSDTAPLAERYQINIKE